MTKKPKLNDLQLILLSAASQREDGSLLPLPEPVAKDAPRARKAIQSLMKAGLASEVATRHGAQIWREQDEQRVGVIITDKGRLALGLEVTDEELSAAARGADTAVSDAEQKPGARAGSKKSLLIEMLRRPQGGELTEITQATGWLPHSARAALTGLRKSGIDVASEKVDGTRRYRAATPA